MRHQNQIRAAHFKKVVRVAASILMGSLSYSGLADERNMAWSNIVVGVSVGHAEADVSAGDFDARLPDGASIIALDDSDTAFGVKIGYQVSDNWLMSVGYTDLGDSNLSLQGQTLSPEQFTQVASTITPLLGDGVTFDVSYRLLHKNEFSVYADIGVFSWEADIDSRSRLGNISNEEDGTDVTWGIRVTYQIDKHWQTNTGISFLELDERVFYPSLGLTYSF